MSHPDWTGPDDLTIKIQELREITDWEKPIYVKVGATRVRNYLKTLNMELTTIARACGKQNVHHLEREDLVALTVEAAAMARLPLAGTSWIPGNAGN